LWQVSSSVIAILTSIGYHAGLCLEITNNVTIEITSLFSFDKRLGSCYLPLKKT